MVSKQQEIALADIYRGIYAGLWGVATAGNAGLSDVEHARKVEELDVIRQLLDAHWQVLHGMGEQGIRIGGCLIDTVGWFEVNGVLPGACREEARRRLGAVLDELSSGAGFPPYHRASVE